MKTILPWIFAIVLAGGCAEPKKPRILDPQFAARDVRQVAVAPVVFADEPLDRYFGALAADEIRRQAASELREKGYDTVLLADRGSGYAGPPRVSAEADPLRTAPPVPAGSDAVLQVRVDNFLDAGLYDERSRIPLDIYATATLIGEENRILWQGEGRGQGNWHAVSRLGPEDYRTAAAFLADSLLATLPSPGAGGQQ